MTAENSWDNEQRYLINGTPFSSYEDLTNMIGKLKPKRRKRQRQLQHSTYANESTSEKLLPEIIRNIAVYFTVKKLDPSKTRAIGCSSSSKQHELKECLDDSTSSWWISSIGSFQNGMDSALNVICFLASFLLLSFIMIIENRNQTNLLLLYLNFFAHFLRQGRRIR